MIKDIPTFRKLKNLKLNFFELSSSNGLSPKNINENYYEEQIVFEDHFCLITNLQNFYRKNENYKGLCIRCLNIYGYQSNLEEHLLRCIEQEVCNISYIHPNQKNKNRLIYEKRPAAAFECVNFPLQTVESTNEKLFASTPVAIGFNIVINPRIDDLNVGKERCRPTGSRSLRDYKNFFGEDCVEWCINEMPERETYMKQFFKKEQ